ncbi:MAG: energy transducer TonB [Terriglobales bacterium]
MQRIRLVALAIALIIVLTHPANLLSQDNSTKETYDGVPLCHNRRGVFPRRIHTPDPEYDDKDRKRKIQGTVTLSVILTKEGRTADIKVKNSLTPGLDQQAIKAVSQWTFEPVVEDGQTCPMRMSVQVQFRFY